MNSRVDYFYFLVDVSSSMKGRRIGAVNDSIDNLLYRMKKNMKSLDHSVKIVTLAFSDTVIWSGVYPVNVQNYSFHAFCPEKHASNLGMALFELDAKLQRQNEAHPDMNYNTTIVLFTDGLITDNYREALSVLYNNIVFLNANRIGVTFTTSFVESLAKQALYDFCGGTEGVIVDDFVNLNAALFKNYN